MPDSPPPPPPPLPESTSHRSRSRSRSPPRQPKKSSTGGFRWKEKRPERGGHRDREGGGGGGGEDARRLDRGYRARSPRREYDPRDRREYSSRDDGRDARDRDRERDRGYGYRDRERDYPRDRDRDRRDSYQPRDRDRDDRTRDRDRESYNPRARDRPENPTATSTDNPLQKEKKEKKKKRPAIPSEPMILVHVNDRLGTKATVPCLPSDTVGDLKTLVAAQIGRAPREILLKRQGERPFKDFISLGDYGITNGVQLDLEIGTGD